MRKMTRVSLTLKQDKRGEGKWPSILKSNKQRLHHKRNSTQTISHIADGNDLRASKEQQEQKSMSVSTYSADEVHESHERYTKHTESDLLEGVI